MFYTCGPNEAMVISGVGYPRPNYIVGGRVWVWPCVQRIQKISVTTITLVVESPKVYTKLGVPVSVTGIAQVKIQTQPEMLAKACEMFLGKTEQQTQQVALETLEGHQRAIMGLMTVEEIYQDRKKFAETVFKVAAADLINMGISVVSYTLKDIRDDHNYLHCLGMARTAEVKRDARVGQATASKDSTIKEAQADEKRLISRYENDIEIAKSKRDYEIKQYEYNKQVQTQSAAADLAYSLQAAKTKQKITEEEMEVKVIERAQQISLQEQEIIRKERELDARVRRPAEAEKYRLEKIAEATKQQLILSAQAEAEAIRLKGEAQAFAIEAKGKAEAEQMKKKAEAWQEFKEAALVEMMLEALPKVAAEVAAPMAAGMNSVKMISIGSGPIGAAKLTSEIMDIITQVPLMVEKMTGVQLKVSKK